MNALPIVVQPPVKKRVARLRGIPRFVGPHESRELYLILSGKKPLAFFSHEVSEAPPFERKEFDVWVRRGRMRKWVVVLPRSGSTEILYYIYSGVGHGRKAARLIRILSRRSSINRSTVGPDDRSIGQLLGYPAADIEKYLRRARSVFASGLTTFSSSQRRSLDETHHHAERRRLCIETSVDFLAPRPAQVRFHRQVSCIHPF